MPYDGSLLEDYTRSFMAGPAAIKFLIDDLPVIRFKINFRPIHPTDDSEEIVR
jgi:hypothetical protein